MAAPGAATAAAAAWASVQAAVEAGQRGELRGKTFLQPRPDAKLAKGRSRVSLCFGAAARDGRHTTAFVEPLPAWAVQLAAASSTASTTADTDPHFDACVVEILEPGQWIPPRRDGTGFEPACVVVCLCGPVVVAADAKIGFTGDGAFRPEYRRELLSGDCLHLTLKGELKFSVEKALTRRALLTFRRMTAPTRAARAAIKPKPADALPPAPVLPATLGHDAGGDAAATPAIEREHVHKLYNKIASHWSRTRHSPWPRVEAFLRAQPREALIADVGCGNGKYIGVVEGQFTVGNDMSAGLLDICAERGQEVFVCDNMRVPLRPGLFDAAISIAVLHHFSTPERRLQALRECARIVRPGGQFLVYAWAFEQGTESRRRFPQQDVLVPWHHQRPSDEKHTSEEGPTHGTVDDDKGATVYRRYCHMYVEGELEALVLQLEGVRVIEVYWDTSNWCVVAEKASTADLLEP